MDGTVFYFARRMKQSLGNLSPEKDRDTLAWAHGFLSAVIKRIEGQLPEDELRRNDSGDDSLDEIQRELEGPEGAPVPAGKKSGPKGKSGGVALPLP